MKHFILALCIMLTSVTFSDAAFSGGRSFGGGGFRSSSFSGSSFRSSSFSRPSYSVSRPSFSRPTPVINRTTIINRTYAAPAAPASSGMGHFLGGMIMGNLLSNNHHPTPVVAAPVTPVMAAPMVAPAPSLFGWFFSLVFQILLIGVVLVGCVILFKKWRKA